MSFLRRAGSSEFTYLGDATVVVRSAGAPPEEFFEAVYLRDNPAGPHEELWYHGVRLPQLATRDSRYAHARDIRRADVQRERGRGGNEAHPHAAPSVTSTLDQAA